MTPTHRQEKPKLSIPTKLACAFMDALIAGDKKFAALTTKQPKANTGNQPQPGQN